MRTRSRRHIRTHTRIHVVISRKWIEWHLHRAKQQWEAKQYESAQWHLDQAERVRMIQQHPIWLTGPIRQTNSPKAEMLLMGMLVAEQLGYVRWDAHADDWKETNEPPGPPPPEPNPNHNRTKDRGHVRTEPLPITHIDPRNNR